MEYYHANNMIEIMPIDTGVDPSLLISMSAIKSIEQWDDYNEREVDTV